jgi:hypothetical protein
MLGSVPADSWLRTSLRWLLLPWTLAGVVLGVCVVAPLGVYPHSFAAKMVYSVLIALGWLANMTMTAMTFLEQWRAVLLWAWTRQRPKDDFDLLPIVDVYTSNVFFWSALIMMVWVWDRSSYFGWIIVVPTSVTPWDAVFFFLATGMWSAIGGAFGPFIPIRPLSASMFGLMSLWMKLVDTLLVSVVVARLVGAKDWLTEDPERRALRPNPIGPIQQLQRLLGGKLADTAPRPDDDGADQPLVL